ncbi:MAG: hypothetical protein JWR46_2815, partial [Mycobacterium sp.]|nr:hypothetical protein [Mycobacterium sp.]
MTTAPRLVADVATREGLVLPRRAVIDEAWRAIGPGVEV